MPKKNNSMNKPSNHPKAKKKRLTFGFLCTYEAFCGVLIEQLNGIRDALKKHDINLISSIDFVGYSLSSQNATRKWLTSLSFFNPDNLDGLITWASTLRQYLGIADLVEFHKRFLPLPMISLGMPLEGMPSIVIDNRQGILNVMRHLVRVHGFTRIGFAQGFSNHYAYIERYQAYLDGLKELNLPFNPDLVVPANNSGRLADQHPADVFFGERKLRPKIDIEVIIAPSDQFALNTIQDLKKYKIESPRDIAITGFNNSYQSREVSPPFTTVDPQFYNHGYYAVEGLLALVKGEKINNQILIPTELVVRQSCGCFESPIAQAKDLKKTGTLVRKLPKHKPVQKLLADYKHKMSIELYNFFGINNLNLTLQFAEALISALILDLTDDKSDNFLHKLYESFPHVSTGEQNLAVWQNIISKLRQIFLPFLESRELYVKAEDILHQARILIFVRKDYIPGNTSLEYNKKTYKFTEISGQFISSLLDVADIANVLEKELPQLDIPGCYLCTYEKTDSGKDAAHLILAINEQGKINLDGINTHCPGTKLLPDGLLSRDKRSDLVVKPCYFNEDRMGYIVFEIKHLDIIFYEFLRVNFSNTLKVAFTIKERIEAEKERENLLKTLEQKNLEMEQSAIDMTKINEQLKEAISAANHANSAKSIFLANMSHEIRTPMNSVIGFIELLARTNLSSDQLEYINIVKKSTQSLLGIINDILDLSKIESGNIGIDALEFNPLREFQLVSELFTVRANEKKIELNAFISPDLPAGVKGDALRIKQVLMNLLSNAVKFTPAGGRVTLEIILQSIEADRCRIRFSVIDTGIGIKKELQAKIFKPFEQLDSSISRQFGGTGLGLAISSNLVKLMGNNLELNSEEGKGSEFTFELELPVIKATGEFPHKYQTLNCQIGFYQSPIDQSTSLENINNNRVFLEKHQYFAIKYLRTLHQTIRVFTSKEELNALGRIDILVFVYSPFYKDSIRDIIQTRPAIPRIFIANLLDSEQLDKNHDSFTNIIYEPISTSKLYDTMISSLYGQKGFEKQAIDTARLTQARVLVAEDNDTNQLLIRILLNEMGITVDLANDGNEAVAFYTRNNYDLILMDGNMPRCDGLEAARQIIAIEKAGNLIHTPIVALTAKAVRGDKETFLAAGMDDYLSKPIQVDELRRILEKYIHPKLKKEPDTNYPGTTGQKSADDQPVPDPVTALNFSEAALALNISPDKYTGLLDTFLHKTALALDNMYNLVRAENWPGLYQESHKLKGAALNLRLKKVAELLAELENGAQQNLSPDFESILSDLGSEVETIKQRIKKIK